MAHSYPRLFATSNTNKLREAEEILGHSFQRVGLDLEEIQSTDVRAVVVEKARHAFRQAEEPVLVEDTGLSFLALEGFPGALIKWPLETIGLKKLLLLLEKGDDRRALATTAVGFHDGMKTRVFVGETEGMIAETPRGNTGFGWDAIFIPSGHNRTFAQLSPEDKNAISMRRRALEAMKRQLAEET